MRKQALIRVDVCAWCEGPLGPYSRVDSKFCSKRCRQSSHRFGKGCVSRARAATPIRLAYADPPYPGLSRRYYRTHKDYAGEVDHRDLLSRLQAFDGWALSTSAASLPFVLAVCDEVELDTHVDAWFRGSRPGPSAWPRTAWEPVVYAGGRRVVSPDVGDDALVWTSRPRTTDPKRVIGAKPARFAFWLFDLLGARPGDELVDLFPGSGGIRRAWELFGKRTPIGTEGDVGARNALFDEEVAERNALSDASLVDVGDLCDGRM